MNFRLPFVIGESSRTLLLFLLVAVLSLVPACSQSCADKKLNEIEVLVEEMESLAREDDLDMIEFNRRFEEIKNEHENWEESFNKSNPDCASDTTAWSQEQKDLKKSLQGRVEVAVGQIMQRVLRDSFKK